MLPICPKPAVVVDCSGSQLPKQDEAVVSAEQVASLFQALNAPAAEPSEPNRALQQILEDVSVGVEQLNVQAKVKELRGNNGSGRRTQQTAVGTSVGGSILTFAGQPRLVFGVLPRAVVECSVFHWRTCIGKLPSMCIAPRPRCRAHLARG